MKRVLSVFILAHLLSAFWVASHHFHHDHTYELTISVSQDHQYHQISSCESIHTFQNSNCLIYGQGNFHLTREEFHHDNVKYEFSFTPLSYFNSRAPPIS